MLCITYSIEGELNALVISQVAETSSCIQIDRDDVASQPDVLSARWQQVSVVDANCTESCCVGDIGQIEQCRWENHPVVTPKPSCSQSILVQGNSTPGHHLHHHIVCHLYQWHLIYQ